MVSRKIPNDQDLSHALELNNFFAVPDANSEDILVYVHQYNSASKSDREIQTLFTIDNRAQQEPQKVHRELEQFP